MSLASVRSSSGDSYEILIALRWAIQMLHDPAIVQVAVDSTALDVSGNPIQVDDVVIGLSSQKTIYCQCKKNQQDFKPWKVADLADDLRKAANQLVRDPLGKVVFYSATPFGELAKLKEHAKAYPDEAAYRHSLTQIAGLSAIGTALDTCWANCLSGTGLVTFDLLRRTIFESTASQSQLREELIGQLRLYVTNAEVVYEKLIGRLNRIKSRTADEAGSTIPPSCLTREALLRLIAEAGSVHTPPRAEAELLQEFQTASSVGRTWRRDIGSKRLPRRALEEVLAHIQTASKRILITDGPGSGKTCLLLDLLERLEPDPACAVLFIQGRVYAEARIPEERTELGLPRDIRNSVARMAEYRPVVVIFDSLDVLSLAREHGVLDFFLGLIDQLSLIPRVTIVAACRNYDLKYDSRLAHRDWDQSVTLGMLDWQSEVVPLLEEWQVDPASLPGALPQLLTNPRMLAIFEEVVRRGSIPAANTSQELTECYLEAVVLKDKALGESAMTHLERLGQEMLASRRLSVPEPRAGLPAALLQALLSTGVLVESGHRALSFGHQTLLDVLAVSAAQRSGETLLDFIRSQPATPFVRPSIRSFFFHLRSVDQVGFRSQIRAVLDAGDVAFHLKRLIVESLAEIEPEDDDWRLILHLFRNHQELFPSFYFATRLPAWYEFFQGHWWPVLCEGSNSVWALNHARHMEVWLTVMPEKILANWLSILDLAWVPSERVASTISFAFQNFKAWNIPGLRQLLERLLQFSGGKHDFLGSRIAKWVEATDSGDDLLWDYIVRDISPDDVPKFHFGGKLRCDPHEFGSDHGFLELRMKRSEFLLDSAISALEGWSQIKSGNSDLANGFAEGFLRKTSYGTKHSKVDHRHADAEDVLVRAIEAACLEHARANTTWWRRHEAHLRQSTEGALRYITLLAYTENPAANLEGIRGVLLDKGILEYRWHYELGKLINAAFRLQEEEVQDRVTSQILDLHANHFHRDGAPNPWVVLARRDLLAEIPCYLRSPAADTFLEEACQRYGVPTQEPHIESSSGWVAPPFTYERFNDASDEGVFRILDHYKERGRESWGHDNLIGGRSAVATQLMEAASRHPNRFLPLLTGHFSRLDDDFREAILIGITNHLRYRFGNLSSSSPWSPLETPSGSALGKLLLDELNTHPVFWQCRREAAEALEACAHVIETQDNAEAICFHLVGMLHADDPAPDRQSGQDLVGIAINSTRGNAAEAALILANRWADACRPLPELLAATLCRFANDAHPAVRTVLLRRLPSLQYRQPELGWRVFDLATDGGDTETWSEAERCLYYAYHQHFGTVAPYLARMYDVAAYEPWGRIAALACLSGHIPRQDMLDKLLGATDSSAWKGAVQVFASNAGLEEHRTICLEMLLWALEHTSEPGVVTEEIHHGLFTLNPPIGGLSAEFLGRFFSARNRANSEPYRSLFSFLEWLSKRAPNSPDEALEAMEIMLAVEHNPSTDLWHLTDASILSSLLQEAEEREQSDGGAFLNRVIAVQDALLKTGVHGFDQWLKDAERP